VQEHGVPDAKFGYRDAVLAAVHKDWPHPLPTSQTMRHRARAFKEAICDQRLAVAECSICWREKCKDKLQDWEWPSETRPEPPDWWGLAQQAAGTQVSWRNAATAWVTEVSAIFDVDNYFSNFVLMTLGGDRETCDASGQSDCSTDVQENNNSTSHSVAATVLAHMKESAEPSFYDASKRWLVRSDAQRYKICRKCKEARHESQALFALR
jgi:hypothetical protein